MNLWNIHIRNGIQKKIASSARESDERLVLYMSIGSKCIENYIVEIKGMCSSSTCLFLLPICRTDQHECQCGQGTALYHLYDI